MREITVAEMNIALMLVKSPEMLYNANSLSKKVGLTPMGALKILRRQESEGILKSRKIGRTFVYYLQVSSYTQKYISFLAAREARHAAAYIKRWITELRKIDAAEVIILFGSVLEKQNPQDIDVLLVTDVKSFPMLEKQIEGINRLNMRKIHPLYQSYDDLVLNIKKKDKVVLNALKGIIVFGEERVLEIYNESRKE